MYKKNVVHVVVDLAPIECFHSRGQHLCKFLGTKEIICIRKESNSQRIGLGHQHGRRFIVLGHQYGRRDVMWKYSILASYSLLFTWVLASNLNCADTSENKNTVYSSLFSFSWSHRQQYRCQKSLTKAALRLYSVRKSILNGLKWNQFTPNFR